MAKRGVLEHPKTLELSVVLGIPELYTLGVLEGFWQWVARYHPTGDLSHTKPGMLAKSIRYPGDADALWAALLECHFLDELGDGRIVVHDWSEHADNAVHQLLKKRAESFADGHDPFTRNRARVTNHSQTIHKRDVNHSQTGREPFTNGSCLTGARPEPEPEPEPPPKREGFEQKAAGGGSEVVVDGISDLDYVAPWFDCYSDYPSLAIQEEITARIRLAVQHGVTITQADLGEVTLRARAAWAAGGNRRGASPHGSSWFLNRLAELIAEKRQAAGGSESATALPATEPKRELSVDAFGGCAREFLRFRSGWPNVTQERAEATLAEALLLAGITGAAAQAERGRVMRSVQRQLAHFPRYSVLVPSPASRATGA